VILDRKGAAYWREEKLPFEAKNGAQTAKIIEFTFAKA